MMTLLSSDIDVLQNLHAWTDESSASFSRSLNDEIIEDFSRVVRFLIDVYINVIALGAWDALKSDMHKSMYCLSPVADDSPCIEFNFSQAQLSFLLLFLNTAEVIAQTFTF
ncbi:hypothetical protein IE077_000292 [Cardiosporidium cionae]|uniref:Uncharacterized protein n=1 Tax=Cardiosporidium cionae TaxID=476202 RepID=A0ABQ7JBJ6_9APIC|nr:hypothetical protein IE077_000292 [Cardiosporidium cionae]|eukprot:KAF8821378.1 hypothetical protein IE077_000292 [Cardiosporidium cionae]